MKKREKKRKSYSIDNIKIHNICEDRGYNVLKAIE
jgi:hypothetical protein